MEGRADNIDDLLADFEQRLPDAWYVAVDLELTGTDVDGEPDSYSEHPEERLDKLCRIAETYAPIQVGLTLVSIQQGATSSSTPVYTAASYNVMSFPAATVELERLGNAIDDVPAALKLVRRHGVDLNACVDDEMAYIRRWAEGRADGDGTTGGGEPPLAKADLVRLWKVLCGRTEASAAAGRRLGCRPEALRFVRRHGLDLNAWVDEGVPYANRAELKSLPPGSALGLSRLWEALRSAKKPLIVHTPNDLLFLLAAFEQRPLPRDPAALAQLVWSCFPYVYDTAHLQSVMRKVPALRRRSCGLAELLQTAQAAHGQLVCSGRRPSHLTFRLEEGTAARYGAAASQLRAGRLHEAGCDSLLTAELFTYLWNIDPAVVSVGIDRLFLFRSTDCLDLRQGAWHGKVGRPIYCIMHETVLVACLCSPQARSDTAQRIKSSGRSCFYRQMDTEHLLVVIEGAGEEASKRAALLSSQLTGVRWLTLDAWRGRARAGGAPASRAAVAASHGPRTSLRDSQPRPPGKSKAAGAPFAAAPRSAGAEALPAAAAGRPLGTRVLPSGKSAAPAAAKAAPAAVSAAVRLLDEVLTEGTVTPSGSEPDSSSSGSCSEAALRHRAPPSQSSTARYPPGALLRLQLQ